MSIYPILKDSLEKGEISEKLHTVFLKLYTTYLQSLEQDGLSMPEHEEVFFDLFNLMKIQIENPYLFESYHQKIRRPIDYAEFGLRFVRPLLNREKSRLLHRDNLEKISSQIARNENVILFANHQTEVDPQLMTLLLEESYPQIGNEAIFVAGDRVLIDPMAVPFSMGCNLLCIYSKRHIDNPPEKKEEKQRHNQKTMRVLRDLLIEGGKCVYVAPSGGRDRPDAQGEVVVAPFDPQSIEMFHLMAKQAKTPTHFYPLSLVTFDILPPPQSIQKELGEERSAKREGALFSFGEEIDMANFPGSDVQDRHAKRSARAMYIWNLVKTEYQNMKQPK
ncbi:MAG: hypothetical protein K940chlam9_00598 [Chlamydiae bacterium]|nr:hypothetical protein [Chlamydiota bacterium]